MIRTSIASAVLLAAIAMASASARTQTARSCSAPGTSMGPSGHEMVPVAGDVCPMVVPGTSVVASDTPDGMAMTFTTKGDVDELRKRVGAMAVRMDTQAKAAMDMHGTMAGDGGGPAMMSPGMRGPMSTADGGSAMMMGSMMMSPMHAVAENVDGGARIRMTPGDPAKLGEMREHLRQHTEMMNQGKSCPMTESAGQP